MKSIFTPHLYAGLLGLAVSLSACQGREEAVLDKASELGPQISISELMVMPPFPGRSTAMGTLLITNSGDTADRLLSVSSSISPNVEIHNHIQDGDVMKMRRVEQVEVAPHSSVAFQSGGYHLMMFDAASDLGASAPKFSFTFDKSGTINLTANVDGDQGHHGAHSQH